MRRLNVVWVVIAPCPSYALGLDVIGDDVIAVRKRKVTDSAVSSLRRDFLGEHFPQFSRRAKFWRAFAYSGPVRVRCRVHLDGDLNPTLLEIYGINRLQRNFFVSEAPTAPKELPNPQKEIPASQEGPLDDAEGESEKV
jgi:hypothetical protein